MSLANSKATELYRDALAATKAGFEDDQGVGFTEKGNTNLTSISRQLNTVIFSLIKINTKIIAIEDEITQIHTRVKTIEGRSGSSSAGTPDIKSELDKLTKKLSGLKLDSTKKESGGNLKVYKNPFEILKTISK